MIEPSAMDFKNSRGLNLSAVLDLPEGDGPFPCLIQAHGYRSSKDRAPAEVFAKALVANGFASFRFDFFAHGKSEGNMEDMTVSGQVADLKGAYAVSAQHEKIDPEKISVFGSSLGGMTAILAASKLEIKTLHLRAPVSDFIGSRDADLSSETLAAWKERGYFHEYELFRSASTHPKDKGRRIKYEFLEDASALDCYAEARKIKVPVLIIHGDADQSVPLSQSEELMNHLPPESKLEEFKGQGHNFDEMHQQKMRELCISWLQKYN